MNQEKFINKLESVTGLDHEKCVIINNILENHFMIGKKNKEKIMLDMEEQLKMTKEEADRIYESIVSILTNEIKEKLKHPFGS